VKREAHLGAAGAAYLDTKNTKYETRNSPQDTLRWKQIQMNEIENSKLCLDCQIMVYGRVSADTKTCPSTVLRTGGSPLYACGRVIVCLLAPKGQANIRVF